MMSKVVIGTAISNEQCEIISLVITFREDLDQDQGVFELTMRVIGSGDVILNGTAFGKPVSTFSIDNVTSSLTDQGLTVRILENIKRKMGTAERTITYEHLLKLDCNLFAKTSISV